MRYWLVPSNPVPEEWLVDDPREYLGIGAKEAVEFLAARPEDLLRARFGLGVLTGFMIEDSNYGTW